MVGDAAGGVVRGGRLRRGERVCAAHVLTVAVIGVTMLELLAGG